MFSTWIVQDWVLRLESVMKTLAVVELKDVMDLKAKFVPGHSHVELSPPIYAFYDTGSSMQIDVTSPTGYNTLVIRSIWCIVSSSFLRLSKSPACRTTYQSQTRATVQYLYLVPV